MSRPGHIYLDYNATAPVRPGVAEAVAAALAEGGNPSSVHAAGRAARRRVEDAREAVARLAGADPAGVVFTSGGTEANALALRGTGRPRALVSAVEHDSVLAARTDATAIPVDGEGCLDLEALRRLLGADGSDAVVSVMLANNETGVIQPVAEAAAIAHEAGALVHVDAVQAAGRLPLDRAAAGADMLTLSAHKLGGPMGTGALVLGPGLEIAALVAGGGQERRRRAGTENVPGIAGFGVAAALAEADLAEDGRIAGLRDRLEGLLVAYAPDATIFGRSVARIANTTCIAMPGVASETQVMALDLAGFAVSAGAACSSGKVGASHVLAAMGVAAPLAGAAIRISLGRATTGEEIERFAEAWRSLYDRTRTRAA